MKEERSPRPRKKSVTFPALIPQTAKKSSLVPVPLYGFKQTRRVDSCKKCFGDVSDGAVTITFKGSKYIFNVETSAWVGETPVPYFKQDTPEPRRRSKNTAIFSCMLLVYVKIALLVRMFYNNVTHSNGNRRIKLFLHCTCNFWRAAFLLMKKCGAAYLLTRVSH